MARTILALVTGFITLMAFTIGLALSQGTAAKPIVRYGVEAGQLFQIEDVARGHRPDRDVERGRPENFDLARGESPRKTV